MTGKRPKLLVVSGGVSSVTEAPKRPATDETAPASERPGGALSRSAPTVVLAAALVAVAFTTGGGVDQNVASAGNTWTEIVLMALGAVAVGLGLLRRTPGDRRPGWVTGAMMCLLFADTAASIAWSWAPDASWIGASQVLAYLSVFAGVIMLARPCARGWPTVLGALVLWSVTLCAWSLLVKVFPSALAPGNQFGRLQAPFGYWNAIALCAAMGLPCCLWLGARRDGNRHLVALAVPALTLLISVLVLSYSRSADAAAAVAAGVWLIAVPLRLRAIAMLLIGAAGAAVLSVWFLTHHGLAGNYVSLSAQDHAGHAFGVVLLVVLVLVSVVGIAVSEAMDRTTVREETRRRVGIGIVALIVVAVVGAFGAVATSSRGLGGEISYHWHELSNPAATVSSGNASRVFQFGSSRPVYWHEALAVGDGAPLKGVGELGFSIARLQHPLSSETVFQAHSYVFETYADLGAIGLAISGLLLAAWLVASGRTLLGSGARTGGGGGPRMELAERLGLITLAAVVLVFGIQGTLDWTWFFTGLGVPALLAAGWLAGRGPGPRPAATSRTASPLDRPGALAVIVLLVAGLLVGGWLTWRPLDSSQLVDNATNLADARAAQSADPYSLLPYEALSIFELQRGRPAVAAADLRRGTREQPHNPQAWSALAQFYIQRGQWRAAVPALQQVHDLDLSGDPVALQNDKLLVEAAHRLASAGG
jgi:hypothetical protein